MIQANGVAMERRHGIVDAQPGRFDLVADTLDAPVPTDDKRSAEARLRESEASFAYLFKKTPNPMYLFEQKHLRFVAVNEAACALYGYSRAEFAAMTMYDIRPEPERERLRQIMAAVDWSRRADRAWKHLRKDGTLIDVIASSGPMTFKGQPCQLVQVRDVTQQLRAEARLAEAEAALRQKQKLESLGQLTGGIAHDFNNILSIITLKLENALLELPADAPVRRRLDQALTASARGADLISRLMTFARRRPLAPIDCAIGPLLRDVSDLIRTALSRRVPLRLDITDDLGRCRIDRTGLETAMLNLAVNARDAMPDGGELHVTARNRTIADADVIARPDWHAGDWVEIAVRDTGTGMPPDVQARVFEPLFTTKGEGKGTGLGLAMVHGFVHQSGGFVTVKSALGSGTTFTLYLPVIAMAATLEPAAPLCAAAA